LINRFLKLLRVARDDPDRLEPELLQEGDKL
jgi:hypothetical protein